MSQKNSFIMMKGWKEQIAYLNNDQKAALLDLIYEYQTEGGAESSGDPIVDIVFSMMRQVFAENDEKYDDTCRKRAEAAAKGHKTQTEMANAERKWQMPNGNGKCQQTANGNGKCQTETANAESIWQMPGESESESESDTEKEKAPKGAKKKGAQRCAPFVPPTVDEVEAYIYAKGYRVNASVFVDYYTSNGWMVGKNRMKDWKAAVRTWNAKGSNAPPGKRGENKSFSDIARELAGGNAF